jgi:cytochrome c oxidase subunit II
MKKISQKGVSTQIMIIAIAIVIAGIAGILIYANQNKLTNNANKPPKNSTLQNDNPITTDIQGWGKNNTITAKNFSFSPKEIKVKQGDKVKIIVKIEQGFHDFVIDEINLRTKQASGPYAETLEYTAGAPATYEYYCSVARTARWEWSEN